MGTVATIQTYVNKLYRKRKGVKRFQTYREVRAAFKEAYEYATHRDVMFYNGRAFAPWIPNVHGHRWAEGKLIRRGAKA